MGCGCKNKNNTNTNQIQAPVVKPQAQPVNENIKDAIKRTVEKYYVKK
jgi:hypothetical protein